MTPSPEMAAAAASVGDERNEDSGGEDKWGGKGERGDGTVLAGEQI